MTTKDFLYNLPAKVNPQAIENHETLFHFEIEGDTGGQYTVEVKEGNVQVRDGLDGEPKCTVRAKADDFIALATGKLNPMLALLSGKVKISNQGEMLKYAKIFGLM